jgi:F-type H+-transporting ATPase subunit b
MATLIAELFGFVVVVFVLYRYVWPVVKRMMEDRQETVQRQVEESEAAARRLDEAEKRFESAVAEARNEAARIRDDARADAQLIREQLREQADREVERIKQRGEEQLVAQREQTVRRLRAEIGSLSMQLAERIVVDSLSDEGRRQATVDGFLDELDQMAGGATQERAAASGGTV